MIHTLPYDCFITIHFRVRRIKIVVLVLNGGDREAEACWEHVGRNYHRKIDRNYLILK